MPGPYGTTSVAFRCLDCVGFLMSVLSRLDHTAYALAVYASQHGLPRHHARLASGWRPPLAGQDVVTCRFTAKSFRDRRYVISSSLPRLGLAQQDLTPELRSFMGNAVLNGLGATPSTHAYYHGEKVAYGLLVQLVLEGKPRSVLGPGLAFSSEVGLPITLAEVGLAELPHDLLDQIATRATAEGETIHNEPFEVQPDYGCRRNPGK